MTFAKMGAKEKEARAEIIMITVSRSNNEDGGCPIGDRLPFNNI